MAILAKLSFYENEVKIELKKKKYDTPYTFNKYI